MKRFFVFAAFAAMFFTACNTNEIAVDEPEMGFGPELSVSVANVSTKGYVEGNDFVDTPVAGLHPSTPGDPRIMYLSAYQTPQDGQSGASGNYFVGEVFAKAVGQGGDNKWHHNPKVYWPLGRNLSFLAFSSTIPFEGTTVVWDTNNAASKCVLHVDDSYMQDDILYAACESRGSGASSGSATPSAASDVAMQFYHAQAWIQFQLKVGDDASMANVVKVNKVILKNIRTRGELTITNNETSSDPKATASWNLNFERAVDFEMPDNYSVLNDPTSDTPKYLTTNVGYLDALIPQQAQTQIVIQYQLAGQDTMLEYTYTLNDSTPVWNMGMKYIYAITFKPYEIIVVPTVKGWDEHVPSDFPSTLE